MVGPVQVQWCTAVGRRRQCQNLARVRGVSTLSARFRIDRFDGLELVVVVVVVVVLAFSSCCCVKDES